MGAVWHIPTADTIAGQSPRAHSGLAFEPDLSAFTPLDAWSPASLAAEL